MPTELGDTSTVAWEPWIQTASGKKFHFLAGDDSEVDPGDIAVALSRQPRWAGHTARFYSVAQHCVAVAELVEQWGGSLEDQLHGLLHDATEAYMCDIPSPLKRLIPQFREIEAQVWNKISRKFFSRERPMPAIVHDADLTMLVTEARELFTYPPIDNWVALSPAKPLEQKLYSMSQGLAYTYFMDRLLVLTGQYAS